MNNTVQREAEVFIEVPQPMSVRDTVKSKADASEPLGASSCVRQEFNRDPLLCPRAANGELVDEGRAAPWNLGPEIGILEFELHDANDLFAITGDVEEPCASVLKDAFVADLSA